MQVLLIENNISLNCELGYSYYLENKMNCGQFKSDDNYCAFSLMHNLLIFRKVIFFYLALKYIE